MFNFFNLLDASAATGAVSEAAGAVSDAAEVAAESPYGSYLQIGLIILVIGAMYFFMIRPQRKKQKQEEKMRTELTVGDDIVTIGGICGKVVSIKDDTLILETGSDRAKMRIQKWAIQANLTSHD